MDSFDSFLLTMYVIAICIGCGRWERQHENKY